MSKWSLTKRMVSISSCVSLGFIPAAGSSSSKKLGICGKCSGDLQLTLFTIRKVARKKRLLPDPGQTPSGSPWHCSFIAFSILIVLRKSEDSGKGRIFMMVMKACLNIVQHCHILETDGYSGRYGQYLPC